MEIMTLTDFLLARLAEDEAAAQAAAEAFIASYASGTLPKWTSKRQWDYLRPGVAELIRRHDPARVLRDVEAKRRIVELHRQWDENVGQSPPYWDAPMDGVLQALALPYADHVDYREEWRP